MIIKDDCDEKSKKTIFSKGIAKLNVTLINPDNIKRAPHARPCSSGNQLFGQMSLASFRFCLPGEFSSSEPCSKLTSGSTRCPLWDMAKFSSCDCDIGGEENVEPVLLLYSKFERERNILRQAFNGLNVNWPPKLQQLLSTRRAFKNFL
ncbi:hypothetical protein TNCV_959521 [Trichonephila clavipes]|nr:hypothetical protein TNCV_959521 [Trichonephila clavipes]